MKVCAGQRTSFSAFQPHQGLSLMENTCTIGGPDRQHDGPLDVAKPHSRTLPNVTQSGWVELP